MWDKIGLIGRDRLLKREIYPRIKRKQPFILTGPSGIGKTAVLDWAFKNAKGKKAFCSCAWTVRENMQEICKGWNISLFDEDGKPKSISRAQLSILEKAVFQAEPGLIFIDELERATPALLRRLKTLVERHTFLC